MSGRAFVKLFRDRGMVKKSRGLTTQYLDLLFAKLKSKGRKRLTFKEFKTALETVGREQLEVRDATDVWGGEEGGAGYGMRLLGTFVDLSTHLRSFTASPVFPPPPHSLPPDPLPHRQLNRPTNLSASPPMQPVTSTVPHTAPPLLSCTQSPQPSHTPFRLSSHAPLQRSGCMPTSPTHH